jgi:hypothetical protein
MSWGSCRADDARIGQRQACKRDQFDLVGVEAFTVHADSCV